MNKYFKEYCLRGLIFGGFGPIICGLVYMIISLTNTKLELTGTQIFIAILTSYLLGFVSAGSSIFEQIESWSIFKSLVFHLLSIYLVYLFTYLVNSWIPLDFKIILIFSLCVIGGFLIIWFIVFLITYINSKRLNEKLSKH